MRCAIYARFSSELQDMRSITDQVDLARRYAASHSMKVIGVYEDAGISGASAINRPGLQRLIADASTGKFDVVVTESLDRLSRSQADIAALYERLTFLGLRIETLADGHVSEIHVGLKGTMSALFLKDLAQKTRRGQIGRLKAGRIPGGRSYGYDVVIAADDRGRRVINEREAEVVRRIFAEYTSGKGVLGIVRDLNREGVPGPTGGAWNISALTGNPKRRNGLLNNELYKGVIVYNRQRFLKDPTTGKRVARPNPESEWLRHDAPELRLVEEEVWQQAQAIRSTRGASRPHKVKRPQRLLSGLIYCGCCGSRYNVASRDWLRCSAQVNSGTCAESRPIKMGEIEQRVLLAIRSKILTPELIEVAAQAYQEVIAAQLDRRDDDHARLSAELEDLDRKTTRLLRLVEDGHADPAITGPRLNELAARKRELTATLAERPASKGVVPIVDGGAGYRSLIGDLSSGLAEGEPGAHEAVGLVRGLVSQIVVGGKMASHDRPERQVIEMEADLSGIMQLPEHDCKGGCGGPLQLLQYWAGVRIKT